MKAEEILDAKIEEYLSFFTYLYPNILEWYKSRVIPDKENRFISLVSDTYGIRALVIADKKEGKLCHLSVDPVIRHSGIGSGLYITAIETLRRCGHITVFTECSLHTLLSFIPMTLKHDHYWTALGLKPAQSRDLKYGHDIVLQLKLEDSE